MTVYTLMAECRYNAFKGVFSTLKAAKECWKENCQIAAQEFSFVIYKSDTNESIYDPGAQEAHRYPVIEHKYYGDEWIPVDEAEYERIFNS
jgi:hypothetical protein